MGIFFQSYREGDLCGDNSARWKRHLSALQKDIRRGVSLTGRTPQLRAKGRGLGDIGIQRHRWQGARSCGEKKIMRASARSEFTAAGQIREAERA
jgi:hypothetical protein